MQENIERTKRFYYDLKLGTEVIIGDSNGSIRIKVVALIHLIDGSKETFFIRGPITFTCNKELLLGDFTYEIKGDEYTLQILKLIDY